MTSLQLRINDKTIYEGAAIAVPRAGEEIHHDGKVVRVEALVWSFTEYLVTVSLIVSDQPYTF